MVIILNNIIMIVSVIFVLVGGLGCAIYWFFNLEKEKQIQILKEWLILAVIQAEKELGDGTGQVKLRYVYDMFIDKFKFLAQIITFEQFSSYVDEALVIMKDMINNNKNVVEYISK